MAISGNRGVINRNPGNIKQVPQIWDGSEGQDDKGHARFVVEAYGLRAMIRTLYKIISKSKKKTLLGLFEVYAPVEDGNKPDEYAKFVAGKMGTGINDSLKIFDSKGKVLDKSLLKQLIRAMVSMEIMNGWEIAECDMNNSILLYEKDF